MQNIQIPDDQFEKLTVIAQAAGYDDVPAFVKALADEPIEDPRGTLSEEERAASLEMIRESEADIAAGRTQDMREGLRQIAEKRGLTIQR
jgi:predicted transcriptional regulator